MTIPAPPSGLRACVALGTLLSIAACGGGGEGRTDTGGEAVEDAGPVAERGTYLNVVLPSVIRRGAEQTVELRVITQAGLPDYDFEGAFRIEASAPGVEFPERMMMEPTQEGFFVLHGLKFQDLGVQFVRGVVPGDTVQQIANPVVVMDDPEWSIYWGDLNGHSDLSSGGRSPGLYYWYGKAVALLDFVALTDNGQFEDKTLDAGGFADFVEVAEEADQPGEFAALLGFEWSSRKYGHRLVYFPEAPESVPTVASGVDTPAKLRAAVPEGTVIALAHPSGSQSNPPTDPGAAGSGDEQLAEIYSSLGVFEMGGTPRASNLETPGAFVLDLMQKGFHPGFIADSDTRLTTPGNPRGLPHGDHRFHGGLTAVLAKELTREAVLDALRERRCYATTGPRYLLEFTVDGEQMGARLEVPSGHRARVYGSLGSTTKWRRVDVVGPQGPVATLTPESDVADVVEIEHFSDPIDEPTFFYLRGVDEAGDMAWASPITVIPG